jgi:hypothetical protein
VLLESTVMSRNHNRLHQAFVYTWVASQLLPSLSWADNPAATRVIQVRNPAAEAAQEPTSITPIRVPPVEQARPPASPPISAPHTAPLATLPGVPSSPVQPPAPPVASPVEESAQARARPDGSPADNQRPENDYLSWDEAQSILKAKIIPSENKFQISGVIFEECRQRNPSFRISPFKDLDKAKFGFMIEDRNGAVRNCMKEMVRAGQNCQTARCVPYTQELEVPVEPNSEIRFFQRGLWSVNNQFDSTWIESPPIKTYVGTTSKNKKAAEEAAIKRAERVKQAEAVVEGCITDPEGQDIANRKIDELVEIGAWTPEQAEAKIAVGKKSKFDTLKQNAVSEECSDKSSKIREEARIYARENPKMKDKVASEVLIPLAHCVVKDKEGSEVSDDDRKLAKSILNDASSMGSATVDRKVATLQKNLRDMGIAAKAGQGRAGYAQYVSQRRIWEREVMKCNMSPPQTAEGFASCQETSLMLRNGDQAMQQSLFREQQMYQRQWMSGNLNPFGGQQFGSGFNAGGFNGLNPIPGSGAMQQPGMMAQNPQFGYQPQFGQMSQIPMSGQNQPGMWAGGSFGGGGANPALNY